MRGRSAAARRMRRDVARLIPAAEIQTYPSGGMTSRVNDPALSSALRVSARANDKPLGQEKRQEMHLLRAPAAASVGAHREYRSCRLITQSSSPTSSATTTPGGRSSLPGRVLALFVPRGLPWAREPPPALRLGHAWCSSPPTRASPSPSASPRSTCFGWVSISAGRGGGPAELIPSTSSARQARRGRRRQGDRADFPRDLGVPRQY